MCMGGTTAHNHSTLQQRYNTNLLLTNETNQHYVWIKYFRHHFLKNSKQEHCVYPCHCCIHVYSREDHKQYCGGIGQKPHRIEMPKKGKNILKFQSNHWLMRALQIIYADSEVLNMSVQGAAMNPSGSRSRGALGTSQFKAMDKQAAPPCIENQTQPNGSYVECSNHRQGLPQLETLAKAQCDQQ